MGNEFLSQADISKKDLLNEKMVEFGLSESDLNISLSVSKKWKLYLIHYFMENMNEEEINIRKEKMQSILQLGEENEFLSAMEFIFKDVRKALIEHGVAEGDIFPIRPGEIPAFDKNGNFIWGRLYGNYVLGDVKKSILRNVRYIMGRYDEVVRGRFFSKKKDVESLFIEHSALWILGFLDKDLTPKYSKFYSEYFRFVSSIMQYKIPFYLTFYLSMLKLYIGKEYVDKLGEMDFQEKDIMIMFEEGELAKDYQPLTDYGIPMITINKFKKKDINMNEIENQFEVLEELDEYEKMILTDFYKTR